MIRVNAMGLSPNINYKDVYISIQKILNTQSYQDGPAIGALENWFEDYFQVKSAISFSHARTALYAILQAMQVGKDDEVILQAFTCMVVPNMITALGAIPVYVDITKNLTIDSSAIERKITHKTKAIIVQHTFGIPADMDVLVYIAKKFKIFLIEDVAHTIGGTYHGKKLGTFGVASIFSFGRDKAFSSVFGGLAITHDAVLGEKLRKFQNSIPFPSKKWIAQQLCHPIAFSFILPTYTLGIGKILLVLLQKLHVLSFPLSNEERRGIFDRSLLSRFPNALAVLALQQLTHIDQFNRKRELISKRYFEICEKNGFTSLENGKYPFLRYPLLVTDPTAMRLFFRSHGNVYLGDWYSNVIDPRGCDLSSANYEQGSCPVAESIAKEIINLPTYPTMSDNDVTNVINLLKQYDSNKRNN